MPETCPHCGVKLPAVVDAFCPECREDLSLSPEEARRPPPSLAEMGGEIAPVTAPLEALWRVVLSAALALGALVAAFEGRWAVAG